MTKNEVLGERVKKRRENLGYSQKQLAGLCGFSQSAISRLESKESSQLTESELLKLAGALRVKVTYLTGEADSTRANQVADSDRNARYLFHLYSEMTAYQVEQLIRVAEAILHEGKERRVLISKLVGIRELCKEKGVWNESDHRVREVDEFLSELAIEIALLEEKEKDDEQSK